MTTMEQLQDRARIFLRWWSGELRACLPPRLKRMLFAARNRLVFEVGDAAVAVREANGTGERELGRLERGLPGSDLAASEVRAVLGQLDGRRRDIVLRLPPGAALRRRIELPLAAEENLVEVVAFDMERQTPFTAEQVYFDVRILRRLPERQRLVAEVVVVPKVLADPGVALLQGWGLPPQHLEVPGGNHQSPHLLALAQHPSGPTAGRGVRRVSWALAGLAVLLAVAAITIPLQRQQQALADLGEEVAKAKKEADAARQTQEEIDRIAALDRFLIERKEGKPMRLALLDELSQVLPDNTWLFRLRMTGDEVQTFGYSAEASNLIGPLDASPYFRTPQFLAPLMRDQRVDAERFHISLQVEGAQGG